MPSSSMIIGHIAGILKKLYHRIFVLVVDKHGLGENFGHQSARVWH